MNIPEEVEQFKTLVSEFCEWAETPIEPEDELYQALRYASALYYLAITMPNANRRILPPLLRKYSVVIFMNVLEISP